MSREIVSGSHPDTAEPAQTRRTVLVSVAAGLSSMLAGCGSSDSAGPQTDTAPNTTTSSDRSSSPTTATSTPTSAESNGESEDISPVRVTREFVETLAANEFQTGADSLSSTYEAEFRSSVPTDTPVSFSSTTNALERYWTALTSQHGEFEALEELTERSDRVSTAELQCALHPQAMRLAVNPEGAITSFDFPAEYSPAEYVDQSAFEERSLPVTVDGLSIQGTLSMPTDRDGQVPGIVLVHDIGPAEPDRDYTFGPNKVLKDLAWGLASNGVAVYRYSRVDRRDDTPPAEMDIDTVVVNDAVAASERVADVERVQSDAVFVAGHGVGGNMVPRIAERSGNVAGGILLDTPAMSIEELVPMRMAERLDADWPTDDEKEYYREVGDAYEHLPEREFDDSESVLGFPGAFLRSLLEYDQVQTAQDTSLPLMITQTGRGAPSAKAISFERWQAALSEDRAQFDFYPEHNFFFQTGTAPYVPTEIRSFHDNVSNDVIGDTFGWMLHVSALGDPTH